MLLLFVPHLFVAIKNIYIIKDDRSIYTIDLLGLKEMKIEIDEWKQRERERERREIIFKKVVEHPNENKHIEFKVSSICLFSHFEYLSY